MNSLPKDILKIIFSFIDEEYLLIIRKCCVLWKTIIHDVITFIPQQAEFLFDKYQFPSVKEKILKTKLCVAIDCSDIRMVVDIFPQYLNKNENGEDIYKNTEINTETKNEIIISDLYRVFNILLNDTIKILDVFKFKTLEEALYFKNTLEDQIPEIKERKDKEKDCEKQIILQFGTLPDWFKPNIYDLYIPIKRTLDDILDGPRFFYICSTSLEEKNIKNFWYG
jgi:hypothetical protein